jgi:hypothetical protein
VWERKASKEVFRTGNWAESVFLRRRTVIPLPFLLFVKGLLSLLRKKQAVKGEICGRKVIKMENDRSHKLNKGEY